jgi:uncharacterized protein
VTSEVEQAAVPAPPDAGPRWPAWFAPAAFVSGILAVFIVAAILQVIWAATGNDFPTSGAGVNLGGTIIQDGLLVLAAIVFAARVAPPRPWQFGLRATPFWPAVQAAATAYATFWVFSVAYQLILHPHGKQTVAKDLGATHGGVLLVLAAILVIVVAPAAEEFFFRGFFYRALRSRFTVLAAALIDGLVFGAIHYTGAKTLSVLPVLAVLGFVFCMLYERTGSILPGMAVHAINNSISYAAVVHGSAGVSLVLGAGMVAACSLAPSAIPALRTQ